MSYTFDRYLNIRSALSPIFSPDGKRVAFLSDISGNFQVWSVEANVDEESGLGHRRKPVGRCSSPSSQTKCGKSTARLLRAT